MDKEAIEQKVEADFGIKPGQVYLDNDKRMTGRLIKVLGVTLKPGRASCAACDQTGRAIGHTVWVSFKRLATKRLFTRVV
jgi:hypothetical protein